MFALSKWVHKRKVTPVSHYHSIFIFIFSSEKRDCDEIRRRKEEKKTRERGVSEVRKLSASQLAVATGVYEQRMRNKTARR